MSILVPSSGDDPSVKLRGADSGGLIGIVEFSMEPGRLIAPHVHDHDVWVRCLAGEIGVRVGDETVRVGPGAYALKPRDVTHAMWNPAAGPARLIEIVTPAGFEEMFEEAAALPDDADFDAFAARYGVRYFEDWPGEPGWAEKTRAGFAVSE